MISILRTSSPDGWLNAVLNDFDAFLQDHAANEKKASSMAMTFVSHYPDRERLVSEMITVAQEELEHFGHVVELMRTRSVTLAADTKDEYMKRILNLMRKGDTNHYLLDRLLAAAIVEARGQERFTKIAGAHQDASIRSFYSELAKSEAKHYATFVNLAKSYFPAKDVEERLATLCDAEQDIIHALPHHAKLH